MSVSNVSGSNGNCGRFISLYTDAEEELKQGRQVEITNCITRLIPEFRGRNQGDKMEAIRNRVIETLPILSDQRYSGLLENTVRNISLLSD